MKHLLPQVPQYFKANLHTHTTVSDGVLTPEQARDAYREKGYSVLALTDHSVTVAHQELNLPDFLMLTGAEIDMEQTNIPKGFPAKLRHLCILSKDPYRQWVPFKDPCPIPNSIPYEATNEFGGLSREYDYDKINKAIAECNRQGFLVTYNHPVWSLEHYPDYAPMEGLWAMEYRNTGCIVSGYDENNSQVYQDMLSLGKFIVPIMADDMHTPVRNGAEELGGSWTMIGAEKLEYTAVMEALEKGDLYSSCGPEIYSLTIDGNMLTLTCSEAAHVQMISHTRFCRHIYAQDTPVTTAQFDLSWLFNNSQENPNAFVRLVVTDATGKYAVTRAYRIAELRE